MGKRGQLKDPFRTEIPSWWTPPPTDEKRRLMKALVQRSIFERIQEKVLASPPGESLTIILDGDDYREYVSGGYHGQYREEIKLYLRGCDVVIRPQQSEEELPNV